jgi:hypothetical protein
MRPPGGVNFTAFASRLLSTWLIWRASALESSLMEQATGGGVDQLDAICGIQHEHSVIHVFEQGCEIRAVALDPSQTGRQPRLGALNGCCDSHDLVHVAVEERVERQRLLGRQAACQVSEGGELPPQEEAGPSSSRQRGPKQREHRDLDQCDRSRSGNQGEAWCEDPQTDSECARSQERVRTHDCQAGYPVNR